MDHRWIGWMWHISGRFSPPSAAYFGIFFQRGNLFTPFQFLLVDWGSISCHLIEWENPQDNSAGNLSPPSAMSIGFSRGNLLLQHQNCFPWSIKNIVGCCITMEGDKPTDKPDNFILLFCLLEGSLLLLQLQLAPEETFYRLQLSKLKYDVTV